jgi:23S rRNA (pseudouridine1915-N3)-methyltransferase
LILAAVPKGSYLIVLDERGKTFTSEAFAADLQNLQDQGINHFTFAIGGAFGHGENLKAKADKLLRLSDMTWPHMMVRAMLAEQLYRAHTINTGHPYHK